MNTRTGEEMEAEVGGRREAGKSWENDMDREMSVNKEEDKMTVSNRRGLMRDMVMKGEQTKGEHGGRRIEEIAG